MLTKILLLFFTFAYVFLLIRKKYLYSVVSLIFLVSMCFCGLISFDDALKGYSSSTIAIFFGISIITDSLVKNGLVNKTAELLLKTTKSELLLLIFVVLFFSVSASVVSQRTMAFIFVTIIFSIINSSNGKFSKNCFALFPVAITCLCDSIILFSSRVLLINEILLEYNKEQLSMFYFLPYSIVTLIILIIYIVLNKNKFINESCSFYKGKVIKQEISYNRNKSIISLIILLFCVILPVFIEVDVGLLAIAGGLVCIITNCISDKDAVSSINWNVVIHLGAIKGICTVFKKSGIFECIVSFFSGFSGGVSSVFIMLIILSLLSGLITYFVDSKISVSILLPIFLSFPCMSLIDARIIAFALVSGMIFRILSPLSVKNIIISENGDIDMKHLFKINTPYVLITWIVSIFVILFLLIK